MPTFICKDLRCQKMFSEQFKANIGSPLLNMCSLSYKLNLLDLCPFKIHTFKSFFKHIRIFTTVYATDVCIKIQLILQSTALLATFSSHTLSSVLSFINPAEGKRMLSPPTFGIYFAFKQECDGR